VLETRLDTARIREARRVINPIFLNTPLYRCEALQRDLGCAVSIKLETANPVRSFKGRAAEVIATLLADSGSRTAVCASAGNLGQALAWSGRGRGLAVTVVASRSAPTAKLDRIRALGARLELVDGDFDTASEHAAAIALDRGIRLVEDSLDIETCEGAATIGLELVDAATSFDTVLIALGGGALATGIGHVLKTQTTGVEVICVQPLGAPAMTHSWRKRRVVTTDSTNTIADGVAGRRPIPAVLDDLLLVAAERRGLRRNPEVQRLIKENERSVLVSALMNGLYEDKDVAPTPAEINGYFERHKDQLRLREPFLRIRYLKASDADSARAARSELQQAMNTGAADSLWPEIASRYASDEAVSRSLANSYVAENSILRSFPYFRQALTSLSSGQISQVVEEQGEFHFVQVVDRVPAGSVPTIEWIEDELRQRLMIQGRKQMYTRQVQRLRNEAIAREQLEIN
jgi:threonine dehydratase